MNEPYPFRVIWFEGPKNFTNRREESFQHETPARQLTVEKLVLGYQVVAWWHNHAPDEWELLVDTGGYAPPARGVYPWPSERKQDEKVDP